MKTGRLVFVSIITFITVEAISDNSVGVVVVNTTIGIFRGEQRSVENDQGEYYAFHAIPYASPPVSTSAFTLAFFLDSCFEGIF